MKPFDELTPEDFAALTPEDARAYLDEASAEGLRKQQENERLHAEFHGRPLRYGRVERRRGYKGRTVCLDCYYGREFR